jgi:hypothetical protein
MPFRSKCRAPPTVICTCVYGTLVLKNSRITPVTSPMFLTIMNMDVIFLCVRLHAERPKGVGSLHEGSDEKEP